MVVVAVLVLSCIFCGLTAESHYDYACQWCCCLAVATWNSSRGPTIKKGGWGARGEGAAPPPAMRSMLLVVVCVRLLIDTMLSLKKPSFVAFVAWLLILLPFYKCCLHSPCPCYEKGRTTGKMNGTMKRLLLLTVENISVPPCLVSFFLSSCSCSCSCSCPSCCSCCCSCKPQKPKKTKSIEKPGNQPTAKSQEAKKPKAKKPRSHRSQKPRSHRSQKPRSQKPRSQKPRSQESRKTKKNPKIKKQDEAHEPECRHVCWGTETLLIYHIFQRTHLWGTLTWHTEVTLLQDTLLTWYSCKTLLTWHFFWDTLTWPSSGTLLLDTSYLTLL